MTDLVDCELKALVYRTIEILAEENKAGCFPYNSNVQFESCLQKSERGVIFSLRRNAIVRGFLDVILKGDNSAEWEDIKERMLEKLVPTPEEVAEFKILLDRAQEILKPFGKDQLFTYREPFENYYTSKVANLPRSSYSYSYYSGNVEGWEDIHISGENAQEWEDLKEKIYKFIEMKNLT